jgi:hypothetical protein
MATIIKEKPVYTWKGRIEMRRARCQIHVVVSWKSTQRFGFMVPLLLTMETTIIWDVTSCSLVEVHQHFGGMYCLHLQDQGGWRENNKQEASWVLSLVFSFFTFLGILLTLKIEGVHIPPKHQWTSTGLHDIIFQKLVLFIVHHCHQSTSLKKE